VSDTLSLREAFDRLPDLVAGAVDGLSPEQLHWAPAPGANSIGWLIWHLTRIQDDHIAELLDEPQIWASGTHARRVGLDPDPANTGYAHTPADVDAVRPESAEALVDYYAEVADRTDRMLDGLTDEDLDRIVDRRWDPPVTLGVRLVSVADDDIQHAGQAAFVRGVVENRG